MGRGQAPRIDASAEDQGSIDFADGDRGKTLRLYLDTSALVKLYLEEDESRFVRDGVARAGLIVTSMIAYVEARAAFARRRYVGDLSPADYRRVVTGFDADWERWMRLQVTEALIHDAARLAEAHRLRAYDSIHLASAKTLRERVGEDVFFASWDRDLERAASREDFEILRVRRK